jgi:2-polyprenyl-6-methoxyphenol hydroxylase-like FAD-dependent oxidoreductase
MTRPAGEYDVAVVGYGPSAQLLAALLARAGHRVVAFERYPFLYNLPRAGHIDHETMRLVQGLGDAEAFARTLWECRGDYVWLNARRQVLMLQPMLEFSNESVSGWYSDYTQWQPNLEAILDAAARSAGVEVHLGWEATGLAQDEDGVTLTASRTRQLDNGHPVATSEQRTVRARYVVGADGANSFVRNALGIQRADIGSGERWLDVDMLTLEPVAFEPNIGQICDPARPRMLMPLGAAHRRFEWMLLPGESIEEFERPAMAWKLLEEFHVTPRTHQIARQIVYTFQARMAERWHVGRAYLMGDAAHTMPPYAGQGLLSALRDASNLSWKLHLVLGGHAPEALLASYESERRPHVAGWTSIALGEGAISSELDPVRAAERDARMLGGAPFEVPLQPVLGPGVLQGGQAPVGHLVGSLGLQARVQTPAGTGRFDDLLGPRRFSVLAIGAHPHALLDAHQRAQLGRLDALCCEVLPAGSAPRDGAIVDVAGRYHEYFARHGIAVVINRPDFHVFGAVAESASLPGLVDELCTRLGLEGTHA